MSTAEEVSTAADGLPSGQAHGDNAIADSQVSAMKRKASPATTANYTAKRTRLDNDEGPANPEPSATNALSYDEAQEHTPADDTESPAGKALATEARRASLSSTNANRRLGLSSEEKTRGKRLFGGLLNTLSQTAASSQQKRRLEIERRQQDRAQQQRAESDKRRAGRLKKVERQRVIEQVQFDEHVMQTRHSHMLAQAHHLKTRAQPNLYYRPWKLTGVQDEIIKDQVEVADRRVEEERADFKIRKQARLQVLGIVLDVSRPSTALQDAERPSSDHPSADTANIPPNIAGRETQPGRERLEEHGDVMVEGGEDTIIY